MSAVLSACRLVLVLLFVLVALEDLFGVRPARGWRVRIGDPDVEDGGGTSLPEN